MARRKALAIPDDLLDQLLTGGDAATALYSGDLVNVLKKALAERVLSAEMDYHSVTTRRSRTAGTATAASRCRPARGRSRLRFRATVRAASIRN